MANHPLCSLDNVKQQLNIGQHGTLNTFDDDLLTRYVYEASSAVEAHCGRRFADVTNGIGTLTRKFDYASPPLFGRVLFVDDDLLSVTTLTNGDGNAIASTNYRLLPPNDSPKYGIELYDDSTVSWVAGDHRQEAIQVQGSWGYATSTLTMPQDVRTAASKLAAWFYQTRDNDGTRIAFADGSMSIPPDAPPMVFKLLQRYVKVQVTP